MSTGPQENLKILHFLVTKFDVREGKYLFSNLKRISINFCYFQILEKFFKEFSSV